MSIKRDPEKEAFETGAFRGKKSQNKGRYDLLPWEAIHELAIHCAEGAEIYGERNCEKGIPIHSLIDSATRHLSCYMRGMNDEPHLRAALWNVAFAIWMEQNRPEMQDIPTRMKRKPKDSPNCRLCRYLTLTHDELNRVGKDPCIECEGLSNWAPKAGNEIYGR